MNKIYITIGVIVIIVLAIIGFNSKSKVADNNPITIGAVLSLTGDAAPGGEYAKKGIDLAVKEINDKGGMHGRPVIVLIEDDHTDPKQTVSAYAKLKDVNKVEGVVGGVFDFVAQPMLPLALSNKLAFISPATFRIEGGLDLNEQSFVIMPDFKVVIRNLKEYLSKNNTEKLAVVHFKSTFGNEIAKTVDRVQKELGKSGIVDESYNQIGNNDFRTTIAKLKSQGVDTVFLDMVAGDPVNFLSRAKEMNFHPTFISYNGIIDSFAQETDKSLLENVIVLNWEVSSPAFIERYSTVYGAEPAKSAVKYYDSIYVMANAIAKSNDTAHVAQYIADNKFVTPNSTVSFTKDHTVENTPVKIQVIKNGKLVDWK